jgi:isoquinoline 1-oxidoreductase alpha subunit
VITTFKVNGAATRVDADGETPLLWVLRDRLHLTGTRFGCGRGLCGACTVHIDGAAVRSCQTQLSTVAGKSISTIEALSSRHPELIEAWSEHNVPQCGYCQAGQLMSAAVLLDATPNPDDAAIEAAMSGNICRCGTYPRIKAAIKDAARRRA